MCLILFLRIMAALNCLRFILLRDESDKVYHHYMSNINYSIVYLSMNIIAMAFGHFYLRVCKLGSLSL